MKAKKRRCCGIDAHKNSVTVCVLAPAGEREVAPKKRRFRTYSRDLRQLRGWLKNCGVTEIAMESTGQYWRPLWNLLEGEFERLILVNPHINGLNGYKTDPKDAQWIADLLEGGKLRSSWVPPRPIRELRDLVRHRVNLLEDLNRVKNRIEQLCQTGNIKVASAACELFCVSGRKMLEALVEGTKDPGWMRYPRKRGGLRQRAAMQEAARVGTGSGRNLHQRTTLAARQGDGADGMDGDTDRRPGTRDRAARRAVRGSDSPSGHDSRHRPDDGMDDRVGDRRGLSPPFPTRSS